MPPETTNTYHELTGPEQGLVVAVHAMALQTKDTSTLRRLFQLGNPKIVSAHDWTYCRVHADSVKIMTLLTESYL